MKNRTALGHHNAIGLTFDYMFFMCGILDPFGLAVGGIGDRKYDFDLGA